MHTNISNQIAILKTRGMIINNNSYTRNILIENNYYNVINGFKSPFLDKTSSIEQYKLNTNFEEIYGLYICDRQLRSIILDYSLIIENSLKTKIAYEFSRNINEYGYLETSSYVNSSHKEKIEVIQLIDKISMKIEKNKNTPVYKHFIDNGREIPIWAAINFLDFGTTRNMYECLNSTIKFNVANYYGLSTNELITFLSTINMFRNVCAHDNRVMKYQIRKINYCISDMPIHANLKINKMSNKYVYGKNDLFSLFIAFRYLLSDVNFSQFYNKIINNFNILSSKLSVISMDDVYSEYKLPLKDISTGQLCWKDIINVIK